MEKEAKDIKNKLSKVDFVKDMLDIELFLVFAVVTLLLSIIFALFEQIDYNIVAYFLFSVGLSLSFTIVIEWRIISKYHKKLKMQ